MNYTYNDISAAIDIIAEQYEIFREVPQSRIPYTPQNVPTIDNIYELPSSNNPDVQVYIQEQKKRIKAIQREVF